MKEKKRPGRPTREETYSKQRAREAESDFVIDRFKLDEVIEEILNGKSMRLMYKQLGFSSNRAFVAYLKKNTWVIEEIDEAKKNACWLVYEDELRDCASDFSNPKAASVKMNSISKLMAFHDPKKYSPKMDMNINQNISIRSALETANDRIAGLIRDVTPVLIANKLK